MKKFLLFIIITLNIYAQEYSINYYIQKYLESNKTIYNNNIKKMELKEKELKLRKYNNFNLSLSDYFSKDYTIKGINSHYFDLTASYGDFSYSLSIDRDIDEISSNIISYEKNILDFYNSDEKYLYNNKKIDNKIEKLNLINEKYSYIDNIINKYYDIVKLNKEIKIKQKYLKNLKKEKDLLEKKFKFGKIKKLELDLYELEYKNSQLDYELLRKDIFILKNEFYNLIRIEEDENKFNENLEYNYTLDLSDYKYTTKEILKLNKELILKQKEYYKKVEIPDLSFYTNYDIKNNGYKVGLTVSKKFNIINYNKKSSEYDYENIIINNENNLKDINSEIENIKINYNKLVLNIEKTKDKIEYKKQELKIYNKLYESGEISLIDFIKKEEELNNLDIELNNYLIEAKKIELQVEKYNKYKF
ncbi:outer membrane efflux protein [Hypnocyclicus thermotrophus]|uniref:Outer membrane efflux protein n=1 Tax=Hypnocyclicus thermotrophus TaxID=1627895 RepID=A0AA46I4T9_9FUSO|nr:TolC family protein [Hypnocyclicus thermotrophus]TDT67412.1 outer membrane efflux protein [Hypnocyclicus thermotrophus]